MYFVSKYKIRARNVVIRAHSHSCILKIMFIFTLEKVSVRNFARSLSYFGSIRRQKVEINQHMQKYFPFFKYKAFPFQSVTFQRCNSSHLKKTFIYSCIYTQFMDVNQNDSFKIYALIRHSRLLDPRLYQIIYVNDSIKILGVNIQS